MIKVWDPFIRIYHWSMVTIIVSNLWINEEGDPWHNWLGYIASGLVLLRVLWGFFSGPHARWSAFFPTPQRLKKFVPLMIQGREPRTLTHNPLAAVVMILMLALVLLLAVTGYMMEEIDAYFGEDWVEDLHETFSNLLLVLAGLHIGGVLLASFKHKENLILSMITGKKRDGP